MTLAELSKKYGVHPTQIGTWKRAAIKNMASTFTKRGGDPARSDEAEIDTLHFLETPWYGSRLSLGTLPRNTLPGSEWPGTCSAITTDVAATVPGG